MAQMTDNPRLRARFQAALSLAFELHARQERKGGDIPYVSHLMAVAAIVLDHGGGEDEAIAALLHDALEDQGEFHPGGREALHRDIETQFGADVLVIVNGCTEQAANPKPPWEVRKKQYIAHLRIAPPAVRLVSAADKLHNCRAVTADLRRDGERVWRRFNASREQSLWFYRAVHKALVEAEGDTAAAGRTRVDEGRAALVEALGDAVFELEAAAHRGGLAKALAIAAHAHLFQGDKAGAPYFLHPLRMMLRVESEDEKIVAVLHDVVEDAGWTFGALRREGFSETVLEALDCLTKRPEEKDDYGAFVRRAAANPIARNVKLADIEDNLDLTRLDEITDEAVERLRKYHHWREHLLKGMAHPMSP